MRTWASMVVVAASLLAGTAAAEDQVFKVDQVIPLPEDGVAAVNIETGPVTFIEVRVRNLPSKEDIAESSKSGSSRPKPVVTAKSGASAKAEIKLETLLEDEQGTSFMRCRRTVKLDPGGTDDWNICFMESMHTLDWPKVKVFHLVAEVKVKG